jgi:hypothetical protein
MRKDNDHQGTTYTTLDAYQAGFLTLKVFTQSDDLLRGLADYNAGAVVEAARFAFSIKTLKSQIHSMRKNKGVYFAKEEAPQ